MAGMLCLSGWYGSVLVAGLSRPCRSAYWYIPSHPALRRLLCMLCKCTLSYHALLCPLRALHLSCSALLHAVLLLGFAMLADGQCVVMLCQACWCMMILPRKALNSKLSADTIIDCTRTGSRGDDEGALARRCVVPCTVPDAGGPQPGLHLCRAPHQNGDL